VSKEDILKLIKERGFVTILKDHDLTLWKVLETLDDLGYIFLERYEDEY
jgi:hypothetical protein